MPAFRLILPLFSQIKQMMAAASNEWQRPYFQRHPTAGSRGAGRPGPLAKVGPDGKPQGRTPPPGYVCYRCRQQGHFIQNCPNNSVADGGDEGTATHVRRAPVGIPLSRLQKIASSGDADVSGGFLMADGSIARMVADERQFSKVTSKSREKVDTEAVPEELKCPITKKLFRDPVVLPCCGASVSSDAVLQALIDDPSSDGTTCSLCGATGVKVDEVIPNKQMRDALKAFFEDVKHAQEDASSPAASDDVCGMDNEKPARAGEGITTKPEASSGGCGMSSTLAAGNGAAAIGAQGMQAQLMGASGLQTGADGVTVTSNDSMFGGAVGAGVCATACGMAPAVCCPMVQMSAAGPAVPQRPGDWICPNCGANCYASRMTCFKCSTSKQLWFQQQQMLQAQRNQEHMMMMQQQQMMQQQVMIQQAQMRQAQMRQAQMQQAQMQQIHQQQLRQQMMRQQMMRQQHVQQQQLHHQKVLQRQHQMPHHQQLCARATVQESTTTDAFEKARLLIKRRREEHAGDEGRQGGGDVKANVRVKREGEHATQPCCNSAVSHTCASNGTESDVEIAGFRTREDRDRELLAAAIDLDAPDIAVFSKRNPPISSTDVEADLPLDGDDDDVLACIGRDD
eukprot:scaffold247697_cov39-Tisochrysis_lutea.AAC.1